MTRYLRRNKYRVDQNVNGQAGYSVSPRKRLVSVLFERVCASAVCLIVCVVVMCVVWCCTLLFSRMSVFGPRDQ